MDALSEFDIALPDQLNSPPEQGLHVIQTKLACLEVRVPLGVPQADGLLRARHDIADEDIQGRVCSIPAQREHLWAPQTKCSPRVVHWPSRMSPRGDFPPVAGPYLINSIALSSSSISSRCLLGSLPSEFLGPKHAAADSQPIVIGHFRLGSHDVVV